MTSSNKRIKSSKESMKSIWKMKLLECRLMNRNLLFLGYCIAATNPWSWVYWRCTWLLENEHWLGLEEQACSFKMVYDSYAVRSNSIKIWKDLDCYLIDKHMPIYDHPAVLNLVIWLIRSQNIVVPKPLAAGHDFEKVLNDRKSIV